jgi:hypothetical protein
MTLDLDHLEQVAKAATPGPWEILNRCDNVEPDRACGVTTDHRDEYGHIRGIFQTDAYDECSHPVSLADAAHIAAFSPSTALALVARMRELEQDLSASADYHARKCEPAEARIRRLEASVQAFSDLAAQESFARSQADSRTRELEQGLREACEIGSKWTRAASVDAGGNTNALAKADRERLRKLAGG